MGNIPYGFSQGFGAGATEPGIFARSRIFFNLVAGAVFFSKLGAGIFFKLGAGAEFFFFKLRAGLNDFHSAPEPWFQPPKNMTIPAFD